MVQRREQDKEVGINPDFGKVKTGNPFQSQGGCSW
nr:MAG TPA: hypothetical protein [Caudoviricetes sp.]